MNGGGAPRTARTRIGILFVLHLAAVALLVVHYHRYVEGLVSVPFFVATSVLAVAVAVLLEGLDLRFPVAVIVTALAVWAIHTLGVEILSVLQSTSAASSTGGITAAFDRGLLASIPAIAVAFLSTFAVLRAPRLYAWHPALLLPVVVALFWSQGHFEVSIFSHPSILAATMTVFILLEAALTILATIRRAGRRSAAGGAAAAAAADAGSAAAGGEGSDGSRLGRREYLPLVFLLLPLLLGVLMLLLGRYSEASTAQGGGLIRPTLFRFDFADYVNLESEISLSRDLVLLYREEAESSRQRLLLRSGGRLLRRFVLSGYDPRRGFFAETAPGREPEPTTVGEGSRSFPRRDYRSRSQLMQEYFLVNFDPSSLVSVNYPVEVVPFENWNESSFARIYEVTSSASDASSKQLLDAQVPRAPSLEGTEAGSADWYRYYTDYGGDEALAELAREITEGIEGDYARARAIERHFHEEYFYSLRPGVAADGNQLHHFLFNSRKGYCSYFAFSMTLMARSLELPARVAVGFFVDPRMSVMDYHAVRADMAHAWVEVYFENYGWIEFDPTATTIAPGEQYSMSLNMDMEQISALLEELLNHRDELERAGPAPPDTVSAGDGGPGLSGVLGFVRRTWLLLAAAAYLLIVAGYRFEPGLRAAAARDYRGRTRHRFLGLMRVLDSVGLRKSATETVYEYAARLELRRGVGAEVCAELYLKALFGEEFTDEDYRRFLAEERDLVRSLKTQVPRWRRMVGFLAPFLRFGSGAPEYETPAGGGAR